MFYFRFCFILLFVKIATCDNPALVEISNGQIEGTLDVNINGGSFYSFEGVPYADPPIGHRRFDEPLPCSVWTGILKANKRHQCMRYDIRATETNYVIGSEDCLYLNIYTPKLNGKFDVIVYFEGGGFITGEPRSLPHIIMTRKVVYVNVNYRLGVLGFLSSEDFHIPGNTGLKDQILALKWIQKNIEHFGGNPNSVTIAGLADAAVTVHYHLLSKKSSGLFHKAISMSGCLLNPWVLKERPLRTTKMLAGLLGCNLERAFVMLSCLKQTPAEKLLQTANKLQVWPHNTFSQFGIVIDKWSMDPMLPKHPMSLLKTEIVNDVPWMTSQTNQEGVIAAIEYYPIENLGNIRYNWHKDLPMLLFYEKTAVDSYYDFINKQIMAEYFGSSFDLVEHSFETLIRLFGDRFFRNGIDMCVKYHSFYARAPVYHYVFSHIGQNSWSDKITFLKNKMGASHGDDISYVLAGAVDSQTTEEDRNISTFMVDVFVSFAKDGKPPTKPEWPPVEKNYDKPIKHLDISSKPKVKEQHFGNRRFWETLTLIENELIYVRNSKTEL